MHDNIWKSTNQNLLWLFFIYGKNDLLIWFLNIAFLCSVNPALLLAVLILDFTHDAMKDMILLAVIFSIKIECD